MAITPTPGHHARQADDIGEQLRSLGVPERAAAEKRYLKSSLRHLGTAVPEVRRVARKAAGTIGSHCELVTLARALWEAPVHERRLCAVFLLEARVDLIGPGDLPLIEEFVRGAKTWALVDDLAGALLGELVVAHPEVAEAFDAWATDADFWIRRAALLAQMKPLQVGVPMERFGRYADSMLGEKEFFIRKAIGWVLRETSKKRPDEVYNWLLPRAERVSTVTLREAVKYLSTGQVSALMKVRTAPTPKRPP